MEQRASKQPALRSRGQWGQGVGESSGASDTSPQEICSKCKDLASKDGGMSLQQSATPWL